MNTLFGEKLQPCLFALVLPQAFIFVALQAIRGAQSVVPAAYNLFFIAQGIFLVAVGAFALRRNAKGSDVLDGSPRAATAAIVALAGTGPLAVALGEAFGMPGLVLAGAAASGISQAISYLQCFLLYQTLPMRARVAFVALCFAVAPTLRLPLVFVPMIARCALALLFPLGCLALCRFALRNGEARKDGVAERGRGTLRPMKRFVPYFLVIALFGFALGCFYSPFDSGIMGTAAYASAFLKTVVLLAVLWLLMALFDRIAIDHLCQIILLVTLLALAIAAQFGGNGPWGAAAATADLAWYVMVTLLYVLLAALTDRSALGPVALFAFGWTPYLLAKVVGTALAGSLQWAHGLGFLVLLPLCVVGGGILVFLNIRRDASDLLFAPEENLRLGAVAPSGGAPGGASQPLETRGSADGRAIALPAMAPGSPESAPKSTSESAALDVIARQFALTDREREVMAYIYQGYSKRAIAEKLFLSQNTVRTHARTLYAKLGIHSRDALLDLVNGTKTV